MGAARWLAVITVLGAGAGAPLATAEAHPPDAQNTLLTLDVTGGMSCGGCARRLAETLEKLDGVSSARVDFERKEAQVLYDPRRCSEKRILAEAREGGFTVAVRR